MSAGLHLTEAQADRLQTVADRLKFVPDAVHVSATTYKAPGRLSSASAYTVLEPSRLSPLPRARLWTIRSPNWSFCHDRHRWPENNSVALRSLTPQRRHVRVIVDSSIRAHPARGRRLCRPCSRRRRPAGRSPRMDGRGAGACVYKVG